MSGIEPWLQVAGEHQGFLYLADDGGPLALTLKVVRVTRTHTAFQFVDPTEKTHERLLRALYREYRRLRAEGLETA